jgi:hypothetical protein
MATSFVPLGLHRPSARRTAPLSPPPPPSGLALVDTCLRAAGERLGAEKLSLRARAGVPTAMDFPYSFCLGWKDQLPHTSHPTFNPITHVRSGPSSSAPRSYFGMRKGVGEFFDLTRVTCPRWNPAYQQQLARAPRAFHRSTSAFVKMYDIAVRNHEPNPLRVGR